MQPITTCLMFDGQAEEAMRFYVSVFPDSEIASIARYGDEATGFAGSVQLADFTLNGQRFMCLDTPVKHAFTFTAVSLYVTCETAAEIDDLVAKLSVGGRILMPLAAYPFSQRYAWLADRFGVSWQLTLAPA